MTTEQLRKIGGIFFIGLAALTMKFGFIVEGSLFVIVGVSLIMNVNIWRR